MLVGDWGPHNNNSSNSSLKQQHRVQPLPLASSASQRGAEAGRRRFTHVRRACVCSTHSLTHSLTSTEADTHTHTCATTRAKNLVHHQTRRGARVVVSVVRATHTHTPCSLTHSLRFSSLLAPCAIRKQQQRRNSGVGVCGKPQGKRVGGRGVARCEWEGECECVGVCGRVRVNEGGSHKRGGQGEGLFQGANRTAKTHLNIDFSKI